MDALIAEFAQTTMIPWPVILARMVLAVLLGGILGFEREVSAHPAGLRTHMLVCLACATFAIVTIEIVAMPQFHGEHVRADPVRLVEAITAGVAFLAAGFIIFKGGAVRGLTTGAGMWLAAATGLATGLGLWLIAVFACVLGTAVMSLIRYLETGLDLKDPEKGPSTRTPSMAKRPGRVNATEPSRAKHHTPPFQLPVRENTGMTPAMDTISANPADKPFVLQDAKRLPGRFFALISGALLNRLS